jgi:hypothetical protein
LFFNKENIENYRTMRTFLKLTFVFGLINSCYGFTTPIRSIITAQAFASSISNIVNEEFVSDYSIVKDIFQNHQHVEADIIYTGMLASAIYVQINLYNKNWENIELYKNNRKVFNMILLFLFIVFTRNVENAI